MTDKRKKRARALSKKTGMSHQAAINVLANAAGGATVPSQPVAAPRIEDVMKEFHVAHISSVFVGRLSAGMVARSALLHVANEIADDLAKNPKWFANSARISQSIDNALYRELLQLGATDSRGQQRIRVLSPQVARTTFSVQCARCHRWIGCGEEDSRQGACMCGQTYLVSFETNTDWEWWQWEAPIHLRCVGCCTEVGMTKKGSGHSPWRPLNDAQWACDRCFLMDGEVQRAAARFGQPAEPIVAT